MKEIERKFLLNVDLEFLINSTLTNHDCYDPVYGTYWGYETITQHYLKNTGDWAIRVREINTHDSPTNPTIEYVQTMKYRISDRESIELEESIDKKSFKFLANDRTLTTPGLIKRRHRIGYPTAIYGWEVDEFLNEEYKGLVLAEIELSNANEVFPFPFWVGEEVTHNKKYRNARMARKLEQ